jgi:hypothetical protein
VRRVGKDLGKGLVRAIRKPSAIEQLRGKRSYRGWTWEIVDVDVSELGEVPLAF